MLISQSAFEYLVVLYESHDWDGPLLRMFLLVYINICVVSMTLARLICKQLICGAMTFAWKYFTSFKTRSRDKSECFWSLSSQMSKIWPQAADIFLVIFLWHWSTMQCQLMGGGGHPTKCIVHIKFHFCLLTNSILRHCEERKEIPQQGSIKNPPMYWFSKAQRPVGALETSRRRESTRLLRAQACCYG